MVATRRTGAPGLTVHSMAQTGRSRQPVVAGGFGMCGRKRKPERLTLRPGCRAGFTQQGQQPGPASSYLGAGERDKVMDEREIVRRYASGQRSFDGAILERADLSGAGADLYKANLSRADLRGADLTANLRHHGPTCTGPTCAEPSCPRPACDGPTWAGPTWAEPTCVGPTCARPTCNGPTWVGLTCTGPTCARPTCLEPT